MDGGRDAGKDSCEVEEGVGWQERCGDAGG